MRWIFWLSLFAIAYAYVGYGLCLALLARLRPRPAHRAYATPTVSVLLAAHNEEHNLPRKLANLRALAYPADRLQIVVASDGSTDRTNDLLRSDAGLTSVFLPKPAGKAVALNSAVAASTGEILVFMDVRQSIDADAVAELVSCFADHSVGAVSGELHLETPDGAPSPDALGIYWTIEKAVRKLESVTGSVVGVTGAIYALRRELYQPIPAGTLLDDVLIPMQAARAGKRVLFHAAAVARDRIFVQRGKEFQRKVRTLTGNYQLLRLAPWLLTLQNPLLWRLISHKLLRLAVPLFLLLLLVSSALDPGALYRVALSLQLLLYGLALLGAANTRSRAWRPVSIAYTFVMLNVAAACALYNFLGGRLGWT